MERGYPGWAGSASGIRGELGFPELTANAKISERPKAYEGEHLGFFTEFETEANEEVLFKAGISFVSLEGAEKNLKAEIKDWDFDAVRFVPARCGIRLWLRWMSAVERMSKR